MMLLTDWTMAGTMRSIEERVGHRFQLGWNESDTDTALLMEELVSGEGERRYSLHVWNRVGIRAELAAILGMEVHAT